MNNKQYLLCVIMIMLLFSSLLSGCAETVSLDRKALQPHDGAPASGVLVKFRPVAQGDSFEAAGLRGRALTAAGIRENAAFGVGLVPGLTRLNVATVDIGDTLLQLRSTELNSIVEYAEPNFLIYSTATLPTDPQFSQQWGLDNIAQLPGSIADADIDAPEAWDITQGNPDTIVAVIDTGVDYQHQDLVNNIWTNFVELNGIAGVDDDGNGFVDDIRGWNFADNNNDPMDLNNHGTHVAGIIGAEANGLGVTGVNWRVKIMPLKFMDGAGVGTTAGAIAALNYAVSMGAKVSNNSWGGAAFSQALFDAIQNAANNGHVFVTAAGNDGLNNDNNTQFPANFDLNNVFSVAATDFSDNLATFSNVGPTTVDLGAPGVSIRSTLVNNNYSNLSGTSMAAPFVSGAAALLLAKNSNLTVSDIRSAILSSVDPLSSLTGLVASGGRLNLFAALNSVPSGVPVSPVLNLSPQSVSLRVGEQQQFVAAGGSEQFIWNSSSTVNATVDGAGLLTAVTDSNGSAISIWATDSVNGGDTPLASVQVLPAEIQPVNIVSMTQGNNLTFNILGGQGPFNWSTVDSSGSPVTGIASFVSTSADSRQVVIRADAAGQFVLRATDASLTLSTQLITVNSAATAPPASPLVLSLSGIIQGLPGQEQLVTVSGGSAPYTWASSDSGFASVAVNDVTGANATVNFVRDTVVGQPVRIRVVDTGGQSAEIFFDIRSSLAIVNPGDNNITLGQSKALTVVGGTAPYSWTASLPGVSVAVRVDTATADVIPGAGTSGQSMTVTVSDSTGASVNQLLNILDPAPLAVLPLTVWRGVNPVGAQLQVSGGVAPYQFGEVLFGMAVSALSVANTGLVTPVTGSTATSASVQITDQLGQTITANVTILEVTVSLQDSAGTAISFVPANGTARLVASGAGDINWVVNSAPAGALLTPQAANSMIADLAAGAGCGSMDITATDANANAANIVVNICQPAGGHR